MFYKLSKKACRHAGSSPYQARGSFSLVSRVNRGDLGFFDQGYPSTPHHTCTPCLFVPSCIAMGRGLGIYMDTSHGYYSLQTTSTESNTSAMWKQAQFLTMSSRTRGRSSMDWFVISRGWLAS